MKFTLNPAAKKYIELLKNDKNVDWLTNNAR